MIQLKPRGASGLLLLLLLGNCRYQLPVAPPVNKSKPPVTQEKPPPPPPAPRNPQGTGPEPPPVEISSFLNSIDPRGPYPQVRLFQFADSENGQITFGGRAVRSSKVLSLEETSEFLTHLSSPFSYSEFHPMCTDEGFGARIQTGTRTLDLVIGCMCRHVYRAGSTEELGFLSRSGAVFFAKVSSQTFRGAT